MNPLLAALLGAAIVGGLVMLVMYFRPAPPKTRKAKSRTIGQEWQRLSKTTRNRLLVGVGVGLVVAIVTNLPVMVIVVPAAWVGLPLVLGKPSTYERDLLLALETWARALSSTAATGSFTLTEVIGITRGSVPALLRAPVEKLYARTHSTWSTADALYAFADELNSSYADEVVIYLVQAAEFSSGGLARALTGVADGLAGQAKLRIELQTEREKPRRTMATMTGIIGVVVVGIILFSGTEQMAFYKTPLGAVLLTMILGSFVLLLIWAKSLTRVAQEPRILQTARTTREGRP